MKIRGSEVRLSLILPHPPEDNRRNKKETWFGRTKDEPAHTCRETAHTYPDVRHMHIVIIYD